MSKVYHKKISTVRFVNGCQSQMSRKRGIQVNVHTTCFFMFPQISPVSSARSSALRRRRKFKFLSSEEMPDLRTPSYMFMFSFWFLLLIQSQVFCYQYKVGDLDSWGIPTSADPQLYTKWSKFHTFRLGDSLLFLYPPSQDSVIQVTEQFFKTCNLKDPILYMDNGNSLFNITSSGEFYFTSGKPGHCEKKQKLHISVPGNGSAFSPSYGPSALPDSAAGPSYPTVFGSIPQPPSSSSPYHRFSVFMTAILGSAICAVIKGIM